MIIPTIGEVPENVQIVADCFRVGPMMDEGTRIGGNVYVVAVPGATQEVTCSTDGSDASELTYNYVFAVGPGDAEYNGHFQINLVVRGQTTQVKRPPAAITRRKQFWRALRRAS